ncbi:hypothetical protein R1sor_024072 [Riccia sorocarpa]|uniref:Uncharacterized protein n=1 Tax=Riccia sorocarpa TaxID=122646 RepID=A0ABD3GTI3_9MARC
MPPQLLLLSRIAASADHPPSEFSNHQRHYQQQKKHKYSSHMPHRLAAGAGCSSEPGCYLSLEQYHGVLKDGVLIHLVSPTTLVLAAAAAAVNVIMFRCRSVWARYISLTLLLLLNSLFVTTGSSLQLRKAYTERSLGQSLVTGLQLQISDSEALSQELKQDAGSSAREWMQGISVEGKTTYTGNWEFETGMNRHANDHDGSRKNRRLFRGRTDRPRPQRWRFLRGRRMMEASTTTETAANPSQPLYLGPPAPSTIVHNEKQDWNQDYAEPDVHPPSSN